MLLISAHVEAQTCGPVLWGAGNGYPVGPYSSPNVACATLLNGLRGPGGAWGVNAYTIDSEAIADPAGYDHTPIGGYPYSGAYCNFTQIMYDCGTSCPYVIQQNTDGLPYVYAIPPTGPCPQYWLVATPPPQAETCSADCVPDPINPGIGNVYATEDDVTYSGAGTVAFRRFYNSADQSGMDGVPGWRHSYDRSITTIYQSPGSTYPGQSSSVSPEFTTPALACTS